MGALADALPRPDLEVLGLLPRSSNNALLVRVGGGEASDLAVYKPIAGERPLWDFPEGSLCLREVAASLVAAELGWPRIPHAELVEGPFGPGVLSAFVPFDPAQHFFTLRDAHPGAMRRIAAFDVVANNADRKGGHCLLAEDGGIVSIDHGLTFHVEPKLRTVIWDYVGDPLPDDDAADLRRLEGALAGGPLREALDPLLDPEEIVATVERLRTLLAEGRFPEPRTEPVVPWPPV